MRPALTLNDWFCCRYVTIANFQFLCNHYFLLNLYGQFDQNYFIINYLNSVPLRWSVALSLGLFQHRVGEHSIKPPYVNFERVVSLPICNYCQLSISV